MCVFVCLAGLLKGIGHALSKPNSSVVVNYEVRMLSKEADGVHYKVFCLHVVKCYACVL
jgi:hypothetical protein